MEHQAPHKNSAFEGYYNKFALPSGAHLVVVVCQIKTAADFRPNAVSFTYVPRDVSKIYQHEFFPEKMEMRVLSKNHAFILEIPEVGFIRWNPDSTSEYKLEHKLFTLRAKTTTRTPWSTVNGTPEGILVNLPLPLHWHVHSLASDCEFDLSIQGYDLPATDSSGKAIVHQEKNYASSFPSAHIWVQAREGDRGICCAGGEILGLEAFLLGYRSQNYNLDFRPPFAVRILGRSPFMTYKTDWDNRAFELSIQSFRQKITVKAKAPKGTFFPLSPPFRDGHRENYLNQSFEATIMVKIYQSSWFSSWHLVHEDTFTGGSLEFGAGYYPMAGSNDKFN